MKIGIVLSRYPVISQTFIQSFIAHLKDHEIVIFAKVYHTKDLQRGLKSRPFLHHIPQFHEIPSYLGVLYSLLTHPRRFYTLWREGISIKRLITDANIWTCDGLDYLHFPFGNIIFDREKYGKYMKCKVSLSFRGSDVNIYPIFHNCTYKSIWKYVDKVHVNSSMLAAKLRNIHHLPSEMDVHIIPPALRSSFFCDEEKVTTSIREKNYEIEKFITIGRLHWVKDFPLIFNALGLLNKKGIPFTYTIIGDGPEREHLLFLANELGIQDKIIWLGSLNSSDIIDNIRQQTMYLQSSYAEGFSNSCIEAQSQGLLTVVTDVSGMRECIEDGKTGIICTNRSPQDFAEQILRIINLSVQERVDRSHYAAERARSQFKLSLQAEQWLHFFEK